MLESTRSRLIFAAVLALAAVLMILTSFRALAARSTGHPSSAGAAATQSVKGSPVPAGATATGAAARATGTTTGAPAGALTPTRGGTAPAGKTPTPPPAKGSSAPFALSFSSADLAADYALVRQ